MICLPALAVLAKKLGMKIAQLIVMSGAGKDFLRFLLYVVLGLLVLVIIIIALPFVAVVSLPSILVNSMSGSDGSSDDLALVALYQQAPYVLSAYADQRISEEKKNNPDVDEFRVKKNVDTTWQMLMAIDSARYEQDFEGIGQKDIESLSKRFFYISTVTTVEKRKEIHYEEKKVTKVVLDENGKKKKVTLIVTTPVEVEVEYKIMEIDASTRTFEDVLTYDFGNMEPKWLETARNIYSTLLSFDAEGAMNIYDKDVDLSKLKEYGPGSANIIYYNQTDKRWGLESYGSSTIKSAGCGPTALSMVIHSLSDPSVTPKTIADWSVANGHRAEGSGSYWSLIKAGGEAYGLKVTQVSKTNVDTILDALSKGKPVIAIMGKGHFTKGGHFIVLRGLTGDGKILVNDPNSQSRSEISWDPYIVFSEAKSGSSFWILEK